jgi:hypothetical protein
MPAANERFGRSTQASVVDLTFAIAVLAIPLLAHRKVINGDGDLARHLVTGRHILEHGPRFADPFSFTRSGEPFLAYEWLSQVIYAGLHALAGMPAIAAFAGLLLAGSFALVVAYVRGDGGDPWVAFTTGAAAAVLTAPHWMGRPHLFTFVGLAALLHLLLRPGRLLWLVPLFVLWANLHPGFLYGLIMIAAWSAGEALEDLRAGRPARVALVKRSAPFALALSASFLNPFGWSLHTHALGLLRSETVTIINEFLPLTILSVYGLLFLTLSGLLVAGLAASRPWVGWPVLLVFGAAFVGALAVRRNVPMFALFALPVMTRALTPAVREWPAWAFGRMRAEFARSDAPGWKAGAAATAALMVLLGADARISQVSLVPDEFAPDVFPAAAIQHARAAGLEGRLLSHYTWGGYVLFSWPGQRVFVDSMADFYGDDLVREYMNLHHTRRDWEASLAARDFSLVLFKPDSPLATALRDRPGWGIAHEDDVAVLFVRDGAPASGPSDRHDEAVLLDEAVKPAAADL